MNILKKLSYMLLAGAALVAAPGCSEPDDEITEINFSSYFRPVDLTAKVVDKVNVELSWSNNQIPEQYQIEFSTDEFATVVRSESYEPTAKKVNELVYTEFEGETAYQVRVRSANADASKVSEWAVAKFETKKGEEPPTLVPTSIVLYNAAAETPATITISGTTVMDSKKIHNNTDAVSCIALKNGYVSDGVLNGNCIKITPEGGFKVGDVLKIAGFFNNSDDTKNSTIDLYKVGLDGTSYEVLFSPEKYINGNNTELDPRVDEYIVTEDVDALYIGRNGNTQTNVSYIDVVRMLPEGGSTPGSDPEPEPEPVPTSIVLYNAAAETPATITISGTTVMDSKKIHNNTDAVSCIALKNGYVSDGVLNGNCIKITPEGGFKVGDVLKIAGFFNNSDDTKNSTIDLYKVGLDGTSYEVLFSPEKYINGNNTELDPRVDEYIVTEDVDALYIGRNGNTQTNVCYIDVVRMVVGGAGSGDGGSGDSGSGDGGGALLSGTIVEYNMSATLPANIIMEGTTVMSNKKIHTNTLGVDCITLANSYAADNVLSGNDIKITVDGGFKAGDVVTLAGFYNNADEKTSKVDLFTVNGDGTYTVLFTTSQFINGRTVETDPVEESYTLTADAETLYLGRNGNTGTNVTVIKVVR